MNKRFLSVLLFAMAISAGASYLLYRLVSAQLTANATAPATTIVVATHNLETGSLIKDGDVKVASWGGPAPTGSLSRLEDALNRGVVQQIYEGEAILDTRLASRGAGAGLAAIIPPGMRAVAVRVNEVVGVAGFATPGMRVDVLISGNPPGKNREVVGTRSRTLLQNIEVLSAGTNITKNAEGKPESVQVVNLLVSPEQAEALSLASNETRIQLVLRNPTDTQVAKTSGTAMAYLFEENSRPAPVAWKPAPVKPAPQPAPAPVRQPPPAPLVEKAPPPPITVEVIIGTKRTETKFRAEEADASGGSQR